MSGEYVHEMMSFPKGKFDHQCDSTSQALDWFKSGYIENGFMKWLELEAAKNKSTTFGANRSWGPCGMPEPISFLPRPATTLPRLR
jgi:hypothetical protein